MYEDILRYYLDSELYFHYYLEMFQEEFLLNGECGQERYCFYSDAGLLIKEKAKKGGGVHFELPEKLIKKYFLKEYSEEQLFAIVFAHWYNLDAKSIQFISNKNYGSYSEYILACFLNGNSYEDIKNIFSLYATKEERMDHLYELSNPKHFVICINEKQVPATYQYENETQLLVTEENQAFEIDYYYLHYYPCDENQPEPTDNPEKR